MFVRVTDLGGRQAPFVTDDCELECEVRDMLYEFSCETEGPWCIGEKQYEEVSEAEAET